MMRIRHAVALFAMVCALQAAAEAPRNIEELKSAIAKSWTSATPTSMDYTAEISFDLQQLTLSGELLCVPDTQDGSFHAQLRMQMKDRPELDRDFEILMTNGILYLTDHAPDHLIVQPLHPDPARFLPPLGPAFLRVLEKVWSLEIAGEEKQGDETLLHITGKYKSGTETSIRFDTMTAYFDLEKMALRSVKFNSADAAHLIEVRYERLREDPDFDPARLVFAPPVGADVLPLPPPPKTDPAATSPK
jgi:hypothetical protein